MNWRAFSVLIVINVVIVGAVFFRAYGEPYPGSLGRGAVILLSGIELALMLPLGNAIFGALALSAAFAQPKEAIAERARIVEIAKTFFIVAGVALGLAIVACGITCQLAYSNH
jgi:hypothetical protein